MRLRQLLFELPNELLHLILLADGDLLRAIEIEHQIARLHHPPPTPNTIDLLDDLDASHFSASFAIYPFLLLPVPTAETSTWTPTTAAWFLRFHPSEAHTFAFANLAAARGWLPVLRRLKAPPDPGPPVTTKVGIRDTFVAPRTTTRFTNRTLCLAASAGHLPVVEFLLSECSIAPTTAEIHAAAAGGHLAVFDRLAVAAPGSIDGATLALAAASGNAELLRVLLAGPLGTRRHAIGAAAVAAAASSRADDAVVEVLLARLPRAWYPRGIGDAVAAGRRVRILRELLETGKGVWEGDLPWFTEMALVRVVDGGEAEAVRLVLENAPVGWLCVGGWGVDAVRRAAKLRRLDLVRMICERGVDLTLWDVVDSVAGCAGLDVVKYLVEEQKCGYSERAVEEAARTGCVDVLQFLVEDACDKPLALWKALHCAVKNGHTAVVHFLLSHLHGPVAAVLPTATLAYASTHGHANLAASLLAAYPNTPIHPALVQSVRRCRPAAACVLAGSFRAAIAAVAPRFRIQGLVEASRRGLLGAVRALLDTVVFEPQYLERACDAAVAGGHVRIVVLLLDTMHVRWPRRRRPYKVSVVSLKDAAAGGHVNVFRYLAGEEGKWEHGHGRLVHNCVPLEPFPWWEWGRIVDAAARAGHLDVLRMLMEDTPAEWRRFMLSHLCQYTPDGWTFKFPYEVTAYVVRVYCSWPHAYVQWPSIAHAVIRNDVDRLRLLSERFPDKILWTVSSLRLALGKRSWKAMRFLRGKVMLPPNEMRALLEFWMLNVSQEGMGAGRMLELLDEAIEVCLGDVAKQVRAAAVACGLVRWVAHLDSRGWCSSQPDAKVDEGPESPSTE
ncbi:hypothetical protein HDU96_011045 [Phlyctochytrium bullatum]|nr:hypothetical protein HDU96_011045 [Phlyctochytrium bullatum]